MRIDNALVYIYDSGGLYYGGLACEDLTALPYVGIDIEPSGDGEGLKIPLDGVGAGTPASKTGLQDRDTVVLVDLQPMRSELDLDAVLARRAPGDTVPIYMGYIAIPIVLFFANPMLATALLAGVVVLLLIV